MRITFTLLLMLSLALIGPAQVPFSDSNLPVIVINTNGQDIPDEPKIQALMGVIDNGPGQRNHLSDPYNGFDGYIGIELRGSSSQSFPKKSFGLETRDENGDDLDVALLGMPEESDWVLHGPYSDKSLIRNALAYLFAGRLMPYAPRVRMVEVVLNDHYHGVYLFTEKIKRDANRVNISRLREQDNSGDELTGGYILKLDKTTGETPGFEWGFYSGFPANTPNMQPVQILYEYPDPEDITPAQRDYIRQYMDAFEQALHSDGFLDPQMGYRPFVDLPSFVDFLIVNELTRNVDAYRLSTFFYKDRDSKDSRLHMGPVWDFNLGFGNANYCAGEATGGWAYDFNEICPGDFWVIPFWWKRMLQDPAFRTHLGERWRDLRQHTLSDAAVSQTIDSLENLLGEAQLRNFQRWPVLSEWVWPNAFVGGSYEVEINYLRNWTLARLAWLDGAIDELTPVIQSPLASGNDWKIYPNPSSGLFVFQGAEGKDIRIRFFNLQGQCLLDQQAGTTRDTHGAFSWNPNLAPGTYFFQVLGNGVPLGAGKWVLH